MSSKEVFSLNSKLEHSVQLINNVDSAKLLLLLARISQKLHIKNERAFTDVEHEKLQGSLQLTSVELDSVIETCEFFLQQAAFHRLKAKLLLEHLSKINVTEDKATVIAESWSNCGRDIIENLKKQLFHPKKLESVTWKLGLVMAQLAQSKMKKPRAEFQVNIQDENSGKVENLHMEFTHAELYNFYNQLETIQDQLDSLS